MIAHTLKATKDDQLVAAKLLGISVRTLQRKLKTYHRVLKAYHGIKDSKLVEQIKDSLTRRLIAQGLIEYLDKRASCTQFREVPGGVAVELTVTNASKLTKFEDIVRIVKSEFPEVDISSEVRVAPEHPPVRPSDS